MAIKVTETIFFNFVEILDRPFGMLEFDNSTLANMMAALDDACKKLLSGGIDTSENRKRIGDALIAAANAGKRTLIQFTEVAQREVKLVSSPKPAGVQSALNWIRRHL